MSNESSKKRQQGINNTVGADMTTTSNKQHRQGESILSTMVQFLPVMVREVAGSQVFKSPMAWGVTADGDPRLARVRFGNFKTPERRTGEQMLIEYMSNFSTTRQVNLVCDFEIAVAVAAPGTGKTRMLDDLLRVQLPTTHFQHILRLGFSFNGKADVHCRYSVASRAVREFFCGPAVDSSAGVLLAVDARIDQFFNARDPESTISHLDREILLLDAVETLFAQQRSVESDKCRSVLLIDEVAASGDEQAVYDLVKMFVDRGAVRDTSNSRRGAFFTGLLVIAPWRKRTQLSRRTILQIPLGTFDVWDPSVQAAIIEQAKVLWPTMGEVKAHVWSLLAATGGRPRDIVNLLEHVSLHSKSSVATASQRTLLNALLAEAPWSGLFVQFLLPSLLSVTFCAFSDNRVSVFGEAAPKAVLLNADMLAIASDRIDGIPVLSLRFSRSIPDGLPDLSLIVESLVAATTFCSLDGSGKDFERVWVGLMMLHLLLQHAVRATVRVAATESRRVFDPEGAEPERFVQLAVAPSPNKLVEPNNVFWPLDDKLGQRDFPLPSTELAIDVFAESHSTARRIDALFPCPDANRVHVAAGASIHHKVSLREQPSLAVWHDLWSPTVEPGTLDALPVGWPGAAVVQWKPGTVVYLSKSNNEAVDSLLLVGDAGGSGDDEPHVVLFQFNAHGVITHGTKTATAAHVEPSTVHGIVKKVWRCLDRLLSSEFSATHVLRRAGIVRMTQVTLCIAAWDVEPTTINLNAPDNAVDAPFNVVLMDAADLIALGGLSFSSTLFFRNLKLRQ